MKLTASQVKYGFGKCRSCESILGLGVFRQWTLETQLHRSVNCVICENGGSNFAHASEAEQTKGPAYYQNDAFICEAKNKPCADCNNRFPSVCMDFDHRPEHAKEHCVSALRSRSRKIIEDEIAKCDVVCSNCHRIRTAKRKYAGTGRPKPAL